MNKLNIFYFIFSSLVSTGVLANDFNSTNNEDVDSQSTYNYNYPIKSCSVSTHLGRPLECYFKTYPLSRFVAKTIEGTASFHGEYNGELHTDLTVEELLKTCTAEKPCRFEKVKTVIPGHRKIRIFANGQETRFATMDFYAPGAFTDGTKGTGYFSGSADDENQEGE